MGTLLLVLAAAVLSVPTIATADSIASPDQTGPVSVTTLWVDPRHGHDDRSGTSRGNALKTLSAAWERIPRGSNLAIGYRIMITPGTLRAEAVPQYFESRYGTRQHPVIIRAADGRGSVQLPALNIFDTRYLYLRGVTISSQQGDGLHCELCDHISLRQVTVRGVSRDSYAIGDLVKFNQSQHVVIDSSDISGASDNAIDFVAVQYAVIRRTRIHDAGDWCAYAKGGSAYIRVESNEIYDCGVGGFTAGQGTGFQFMVAPWIYYEAYDVKVVNNVIHDIWGAGLGVNGGYNILLAYNTMYTIGGRSHLLEFVPGGRSCDGVPGDDGRDRCASYLTTGGWGTTRVGDGDNYVRIPNRHVYVYNNLIVNPPDAPIGDQHFTIAGPYSGPGQVGSHVPVPTRFDDDLRIRGNVIWNGPADLPLGIGDSTGCSNDHPTCSAARITADNLINARVPELVDPASGDYRLAHPSAWDDVAVAIPSFSWTDMPGRAPAGTSSNSVPRDRSGVARLGTGLPGAYAS